jgi:cytochrome c-type biogenesis protein CcmE
MSIRPVLSCNAPVGMGMPLRGSTRIRGGTSGPCTRKQAWTIPHCPQTGTHMRPSRSRFANEAPRDRSFRIGGLVEEGSLEREAQGLTIRFAVTDRAQKIPVTYTGLLPDLFKEGKGVVAQGKLGPDGVFRADQVLAKHDENYMPPEAAEALKNAKPGTSSSRPCPRCR